jgi:hypothetical protein
VSVDIIHQIVKNITYLISHEELDCYRKGAVRTATRPCLDSARCTVPANVNSSQTNVTVQIRSNGVPVECRKKHPALS